MTRTTLGLLAADALIWLVSAIPVGLLGYAVAGATGAVVALAAWTLSAALAFLRPVELRLARFLFRAREPTAAERARLEPVWRRVCRAAGEDLGDYVLRIEDRDELNATAGGARIVAVTTLALSLPDDELAAVLAHELGHHLDEHPVAALLGWWFALPSVVFDAILRFFGGIFIVFAIWRLVLVIPLVLARLASAVLNRTAEYAADRHAARLGFGPAMIEVFERMLREGHGEEKPGDPGPARLWATHPPLRDRIARLRAPAVAASPRA
ncbi:MAG TPA: M48 family metalloprotease [Solirubrobacteraceae bacterium]|nr:M48 family metalloprotease [Solirubrobacteraceae bacterium]